MGHMYNYVEWNRSVGQVYVFNGAGQWHICMCWMEQVSGTYVLNEAGQWGRCVC